MPAIRRIAFGTDFSEVSDHALVQVLEFARALGASVDVVHAYALPAFNLPIEGSVIAPPQYLTDVVSRLQASLDATVARHASSGVTVRGHLRAGAPAGELVQAAAELGADLIAVGTHARKGAAHAFLGSVAEHVVRHADRPVLTITPER
jgi:nucleotide-binding universal stress UspA family protein